VHDAVNFNCPVRIRRASAVVVLQLALTFGTLAAARVHFTAAASNDVARGNLTYANHTTPTCPGAAGAAGALDSKLAVSTSAHFTILVLTVVLMMWVRSDIVAAKRCLWIRTRETRVFGGLLLALVFSVLWGNMKAAQWTFESGGSHFDAILNGLVLLFILDLDEGREVRGPAAQLRGDAPCSCSRRRRRRCGTAARGGGRRDPDRRSGMAAPPRRVSLSYLRCCYGWRDGGVGPCAIRRPINVAIDPPSTPCTFRVEGVAERRRRRSQPMILHHSAPEV
jgi:hypothetical protein